jgi:hypothetical protein
VSKTISVYHDKHYDVIATRADGSKDILKNVALAFQSKELVEKQIKDVFDRAGMSAPAKLEDFYKKHGETQYLIRTMRLVEVLRIHFHPGGADADKRHQAMMAKQGQNNPIYEFQPK